MKVFNFFVLLLLSINSFANTDSLLNELNTALANKKTYEGKKINRIESLKTSLNGAPSAKSRYDICLSIYNEYKTFQFDSAFVYSKQLELVASKLDDPSRLEYVKLKQGFILLSSGMFKEAFDILYKIDKAKLSRNEQIEYYSTLARSYYDLADFDKNIYYNSEYNKKGLAYSDSAIHLSKTGSYDFYSQSGLKNLRTGNLQNALVDYKNLMAYKNQDPHQFAINTSCLSFIYSHAGESEKSLDYLIMAAISDIKSATKETVAISNLADILFKNGDTKNSYVYIKQALEDAVFYGARHREIQISAILPIIEGDKLNTVERQKTLLLTYSVLLTILAVIIVIFVIITLRQLKKIKLADQIISLANENLQESNKLLTDANKIKNEYVIYYFKISSEYIDKIERFKTSVEHKLALRNVDEIKSSVGKINIQKEREDLFLGFDKVFLKLFPNFVSDFNDLLKAEEKFVLPDEHMNTELRIYALIRIGITDNDRIAKILNYSVNTIYAYKTRIKKKSNFPGDEFEDKIMQINPV
ncbi:tetratricopeptide repeat protein [Pedobacter sp. HMF7647]|uniref:Tetratricopeptide repeat protein n=1 Tax=Hufsiella arboris TaxID=2695275 RepID=A0A7K1YDD3_9SPHI|nr:DUF6377 domain-containing protein [Hufsiella arboris]MXV52099.1 tetratricopeptide repeat protein [Hufsiella arboris]